jgi:hypothetical protein
MIWPPDAWEAKAANKIHFESVILGCFYRDILLGGFFQDADKVKEALDNRSLTGLVVMCDGLSAGAQKTFGEILEKNGAGWVRNHLIYMRTENKDKFTFETIHGLGVTHLVSIDTEWLIKFSGKSIQAASLRNPKLGGWPGVLKWINSRNKGFINYEHSHDIISVREHVST